MAAILTPEQIEVYAATLRAHYGVTGVWVFGSLVDGDHFTERSDIDLAAAGLTPAVHLEALGRLLRLSPDFELDLVDLESCPRGLRRSVERSGVPL